MKRSQILNAAAASLMLIALAACDSNAPSLIVEDQVTEDLVSTSSDAIVTQVATLIGNEASAGMPGAQPSFNLFGDPADLTVNRTRTCYDGTQVQTQCDANTTDSVVTTLTIDGTISREHNGPRGTASMTKAVHFAGRHVVSGLEGTETFRIHNGVGTGHDTTSFSGTGSGENAQAVTRTVTESSVDSVQNIRFDLPHANNPWPVSGSIVRQVSGEITWTVGDRSETRSFSRRISVTFPADNQGNVTIQINEKTCTLNLVTHIINNCTD